MNIKPTQKDIESLMTLALEEAQKAYNANEVPVAALISYKGEIISKAHNEVETQQSVTAHAECLAIQEASRKIGNWRLSDCILCVTLEPCPMCMGAIRLARIPLLVYGARDEQLGAAGSMYDLGAEAENLRVIGRIKEQECAEILQRFFLKKRAEQLA